MDTQLTQSTNKYQIVDITIYSWVNYLRIVREHRHILLISLLSDSFYHSRCKTIVGVAHSETGLVLTLERASRGFQFWTPQRLHLNSTRSVLAMACQCTDVARRWNHDQEFDCTTIREVRKNTSGITPRAISRVETAMQRIIRYWYGLKKTSL